MLNYFFHRKKEVLWKEAYDARPVCLWFSVDGVSVSYAECGYAGFDRFGVGCDPIFFVFIMMALNL